MDGGSRSAIADAARAPSAASGELVLAGLDCLNQGVTIFNENLVLVAANRRFLELRDIPGHLGAVGTPFEEQIRFRAIRGDYGAGDPEDHVRAHMEIARRFEPHCIERETADGTVLEIRGTPLPGGGFIATYTDITGRKRVHEELQRNKAELEDRNAALETSQFHYRQQAERMEAMMSELTEARRDAEEVSRAKSEFLATMSHELRTPLNAVIGFAQIMRDEMMGPLENDAYKSYAGTIFSSGQHLLDLINDILDLSKVESGRDELYEETIDVPELVDSMLSLVGHRPDGDGVEITTEIEDDLPPLRADPRKMKQVLVNLVSNALKFTEEGGRVTLRVWSRPDSGYVFQVRDTGIGMKLEDIPKALSLFGQIESDLTRKYQGTGLGLPLTKSLVEMHSGSLDLQSEPGIGTTVTVRLPAERIVKSAAVDTLKAAS